MDAICDKTIIQQHYYSNPELLNKRKEVWLKWGNHPQTYQDWLFAKIFNFQDKKNILDAGCGLGDIFFNLIQHSLIQHGTACDISEQMILSLEQKLKKSGIKESHYEIVQANIDHLPFISNSFDIVLSSCVFHHISNLTDAINELLRVTRDGGRVLVSFAITDFEKGMNKIHYDALQKLNFPTFMSNRYLHQTNIERIHSFFNSHFSHHQFYIYQNDLEISSLEDALAYYQSALMFRGARGITDERIASDLWLKLAETVKNSFQENLKRKNKITYPSKVYLYDIRK